MASMAPLQVLTTLALATAGSAHPLTVTPQASDLELRFVTVLFRHGDRTPIEPYPNDPYNNRSEWPVGFGQLSPVGKQMQFDLGKYFRRRYGSLLGERYGENLVYVRSTDVDRTLMSAGSNLAGLFPPVGDEIWNESLLWRPVPVHTVPIETDDLLANHAPCPRLEEAKAEVLASQEVSALNQQYREMYEYVSLHSGANISNLVDVDYLYDTLFIEQLYNKTLPAWTHKVFPDQMRYLRDLSFVLATWTHELKRLTAGPLISDLVHTFQGVREGKIERRMHMYSGHDTTLSGLLHSLGLYDEHNPPPYASAIMVELVTPKKYPEDFYVRLFYRNDSTQPPLELTLSGCEWLCPLDKFDALTRNLRPEARWHDECASQVNPVPDMSMEIVTVISSSIGVLLLIVLIGTVIVHCICRKTRQHAAGYATLAQGLS